MSILKQELFEKAIVFMESVKAAKRLGAITPHTTNSPH